MATKKSQSKAQAKPVVAPQASTGMDSTAMWKWVYVAGVFVAGITGAIGFSNPILSWVLLLAGLLVGFLFFDSADVMNFGLRYLILWVVTNTAPTFLGVSGMAGSYVVGFLEGFFNFLGPVVLAMSIMHFSKKYFANMM